MGLPFFYYLLSVVYIDDTSILTMSGPIVFCSPVFKAVARA